ncbi:MAG: N-acetylmuramoyl-L-alanine amidase [Proteobacteria bacterium]|uniref:N-acetylmuramoyl-L-alanine amidase n=1 Tax=Candidatus Enterousia avistercoris TaxID=2840788 RepID=A0A9D9GV70_9PROT|nr:N-acetylmuramoyl-L-alanine amidase [Candidatus Enterousia avistercoris]
MKFTRRTLLKFAGIGTVAIAMMPRVAFAARNSLRTVRTGVQPGNKTRLVIETGERPSYTVSYPANQLVITLANTAANTALAPTLAAGTLVRAITQVQSGDKLQIIADLTRPINEVPRDNIMLLSPNGDNDYRLVLDFAASSGAPVQTAASSTKKTSAPSRKYVVVIDAGHGGKDPGCIGKGGTQEKVVVLSVAKKLKSKLDAAGFQTYLTRSNDTYLKLAQRAAIGEKKHADLFLSLHANANPSRSMQGFSIYTLSEKASDEEAAKLADAENAADKIDVSGFEQFDKDIRIALSSLQQHAVAAMSVEYANGCASQFKRAKITQQPGPDVRHAPFAVLRSTVPGALIELGHLSNAAEEKLLKSSSHQDKLVAAIVKSVKAYNFDV